ncbi:MAG: hypothetical protein ABMA02_13315 [Saprospiraceae bacterium]
MNQLIKTSCCLGLIALFLITGYRAQAQTSATCNLVVGGVNYPVSAVVPATSPSGLDFNLFVSFPGLGNTICSGNNYSVSITTSTNLELGTGNTGSVYPLSPCPSPPIYCTNAIPNGNGLNTPFIFRFKPGTTCNGEKGTFTIKIETTCGGQPVSCTMQVSLTAVAQNKWSVSKQHLWGNLKGGAMLWKVTLTNSGNCVGDYNIAAGTITDQISCSQIVSVTRNGTAVPFWGPVGIATWQVGNIPCSTPSVEYIVTTVCCDPNATAATNCVSFQFQLGKTGPAACDVFSGQGICKTVSLAPNPTCSANFSKSLTYQAGTQVNYTTGCEGEYTICFSNNGNTPLTNINLSDIFPTGPSGITVQQISVYSSGGVNMNYTANFPGGTPSSGSGNTGSYQSFPSSGFFGTAPSSMTLQTTSGSLTYGTVCVKVRFLINAPPGTPIKNCAALSYTGSYSGWSNWCGINLPPCASNSPDSSCVSFTVEPPKAVPGLKKCINGPQSYQVGQLIPFSIVVSNHGSAALNGCTLNDLLGSPQNLEIVTSSVQYAFGLGSYFGYTPCWVNVGGFSNTPPAWLTANLSNLQNPSWAINGMPGECRLDMANFLVIKFDALIKPQLCAQNTNKATLTCGGTILSSTAPYNILCNGGIETTKQVNNGPGQAFSSSGFVNPGAAFQYKLRVKNVGSVNLTAISVKDAFPTCVSYACTGPKPCTVYYPNGTIKSTVTVNCTTGTPTTFTVNPATTVLAPGEYLEFIVDVTRLNNGQEPCCNKDATAYATATGTGQTIQDSDGPVCVQSTICCEMEEVGIQLTTLQPPTTSNFWNFGLNLFAWNLPIQELEISLMDFHFNYNYTDCKPQSVSNATAHLTTTTPVIGGGLSLSPPFVPVVNNALTWKAGTPVLFTSGQQVKLHIWRPSILAIPCCEGKLYYCLKIRLKDVKCRVCEKIVCNVVPLSGHFGPVEITLPPNIFQTDFPSTGGN